MKPKKFKFIVEIEARKLRNKKRVLDEIKWRLGDKDLVLYDAMFKKVKVK
jgi:hypothetical protein